MAGPPPQWTDVDSELLIRMHGEGESLGACAKALGKSRSNVSKWSKRLGLTWDRSQLASAHAAQEEDFRRRMERLKHGLVSDAERLRGELFAPVTVFNFGGKDNTYEEHDLPAPPHADKLKIAQAVSTTLGSIQKIQAMDQDQGLTETVGMLDKVFAAIAHAAGAIDIGEEP